jgi:hypothetical protein
MECPICKQTMTVTQETTSVSKKDPAKTYTRTTYHCESDDTWIVVEIPQQPVVASA